MNCNVTAVIVTYNTESRRLDAILVALIPQCKVVVVDNSTCIDIADAVRDICRSRGAEFLILGDNLGIAHAQNRGIALARQYGATDVLLMDDDSIPSSTLVSDLLRARAKSLIQPVVASARTVSAVGKDMSNRSVPSANGLAVCNELTSSGALIPLSVIDQVGSFDDSLFIDCVDFEWGWRAIKAGVPLVLCERVLIQHRLGEGENLGLRIPSPIRHYYQYRNVLRMIVRSEAPLRWRLEQLVKLPVKLVLISLLADRRMIRVRYAFWGIVDSLRGRSGKFDH